MTTWARVEKAGEFAAGGFGYGLFGGGPQWSSVSKQSTTWTGVVQSGTVAAQFELPEPIGGPIWEDVTKDT